MVSRRLIFAISIALTAAVIPGARAWAAGNPLTASETHGLVLNGDGTVCGAGRNEYGELGDGTAVDHSNFTKSDLAGTAMVSTGWYHSLALKSDGTVWAWGYNGYGELGDGTTADRPTPFQVPGLTGVIWVAAGGYHSLAVKNDGTVWAWGYNGYGEVGDGTTTSRTTPVQVIELTGATAVVAGEYHSVALKSDGTVRAWGYNGYGQLGNGTTTNTVSPVQVAGLTGVKTLAAGADHVLSLRSDGSVWGWGFNSYGQLGDGDTNNHPNIVKASGLSGVTSIAAGDYHSAATESNGSAWAWGYNAYGELGDGTTTERVVPTQVSGFGSAVAIAAGSYYTLALKNTGALWAWGDNTYGQLGNGTLTGSLVPVAASACPLNIPPTVTASTLAGRVAASQYFSLAVKSDGTVLSWGQNTYGQLGDGTTVDKHSPVQAAQLTSIKQVAAGWYHGLALRSNGTVWAWGYNAYGELGDGTNVGKPTPVQVSGLSGVIAIAAGGYHSLAVKSDGTVWAWGYNGYGELGDGTTTNRNVPVQVVSFSGVTAVSGGQYFSLALKRDGTVWGWGYNAYGQLGNGMTTTAVNPVQVLGFQNGIAIAAGADSSEFVRSDGTVWGAGYNGYGQLGDGSTGTRNRIVRQSGLTGVVAIAGTAYHTIVAKSDGTVWGSGYNASGQLGNGNTAAQYVPVQANGLAGAVAVAAGYQHSLALKSDGTIAAWGDNSVGQLGNGTTNGSTVPVVTVPAIGTTYKLTLGVSPSGAGSVTAHPGSASGVYLVGLQVCLSPEPAAGREFTGWSGSTVGSNSCVTMNSNLSITADFISATSLRFVPVTPCRVADTRNPTGPFGGPAIPANSSRSFAIPGASCGIPTSAAAYSLNVTVVPSGSLEYITVWPSGQQQPVVSTLNSPDGRVKANAAIVPAGTSGGVSVYASDKTNVILDIDGYFVPSSEANTLAFYPLNPCRVADTRNATGPLGGPKLTGGQPREFPVLSSSCSIPKSAQAYSLNFTTVPSNDLGYLTVWPTSQKQPLVSTLNAPTGTVTANAAIVPAGTNGEISVFASDDTNLIIDVNGYFAAPASGGLSLYSVKPCRVLDSRNPTGRPAFSGSIGVDVAGSVCAIPSSAKAFVLNATVVPPSPLEYLTLWPDNHQQPVVSTLNALDGAITSNMAIVPTSNGLIDAFAFNPTYLILDVSSYFAP